MSAEAKPTQAGRRAKWTGRMMATTGVLGSVALVLIALALFGPSKGGDPGGPAKVEAATPTHEMFSVDNVGAVAGTKLIRLDVEAADQRSMESRGSSNERRNVVLLDTVTGASRRILADNSRRIVDFRFLDESPDDSTITIRSDGDNAGGGVALWYIMRVAQPGDNGLEDVLIGSTANAKQAVVLSGIDGVDAAWLADAAHIALIVRDHRKLSYKLIDTASFKVSASHPIAID